MLGSDRFIVNVFRGGGINYLIKKRYINFVSRLLFYQQVGHQIHFSKTNLRIQLTIENYRTFIKIFRVRLIEGVSDQTAIYTTLVTA